MPKDLTSKRDCQFVHARRRFWERLHIDLTEKMCQEIIDKICGWKAGFDGWCGTDRQAWIVEVDWLNSPIRVVYDTSTKQLVTVLAERDPDTGVISMLEVGSGENPQCRKWREELSKVRAREKQ